MNEGKQIMTDDTEIPFGQSAAEAEIEEIKDRIVRFENMVRTLRVRQGILERVFLMMFKDPETLSDKVIDMWKMERKKK